MGEAEPDSVAPQLPLIPDREVHDVGRFEWERWIRRCRLGFYRGGVEDSKRWVGGPTVQHVAYTLATYGDLDGSRVFPSIQRLARVCDLDERTVRECVKRLRDLNLLRLVSPSVSPGRKGGPGKPAGYQLSVPTDLLARVAHLDPDEMSLIEPDGIPTRPGRGKRQSPKRDPGTDLVDSDVDGGISLGE